MVKNETKITLKWLKYKTTKKRAKISYATYINRKFKITVNEAASTLFSCV